MGPFTPNSGHIRKWLNCLGRKRARTQVNFQKFGSAVFTQLSDLQITERPTVTDTVEKWDRIGLEEAWK